MNLMHQHPASADAYIRHGWNLVPIAPGGKAPKGELALNWNHPNRMITRHDQIPPGHGIGLAHAYSGTMALDIDSWNDAADALADQGIDLDALYKAPDAVIIDSGRPGHGKLLYAMPFGAAMPSKRINQQGKTIYEMRCATADGLTVQDVLPPTIHPDTGQPYRWAGMGHWSRLPEIPGPLLAFWQTTIEQDRQLNSQRISGTGELGELDANWEEIRAATLSIDPDISRDEWIQVGMALHWAGILSDREQDAFDLWDEWSEQGTKYPGRRGMMVQWRSFNAAKQQTVRLGTLFHFARQAGWRRPTPDASELFSATTEEEVTDPLTLMESLRPAPPSINIELLPAPLARRATEISQQVGCDPLVPIFAGLAAFSGAVDSRIRLELAPGFKVPPVLWMMTIGAPADKKTPGSKPMFEPLSILEKEDRPRYAKAVLEWEGADAFYASSKKAYLDWSANPESAFDDQAPEVAEEPKQPVPLRFMVADITSQKLVRLAADRPRGILCYLDEMASWVHKVTDSRSGEDRSSWTVGYESNEYHMDRVGSGSIFCENYALSIYGNIQPRVYQDARQRLSSDGLLQRFIPAVLHSKNTRRGDPVHEFMTNKGEWENIIRTGYGLPPITYQLSPAAYDTFRTFQSWYEQKKKDEVLLSINNDSGDDYMTAFGKLEGTTGRLILIFHMMTSPFQPYVPVETVEQVIRLVRSYIIPAYRYALSHIGLAQNDTLEEWMSNHIIHIAGDTQAVTMRELRRSARRFFEKRKGINRWTEDQMILDVMDPLENANWVTAIEEDLAKHHKVWVINPNLATMFKDYRLEVIKARQRAMDEMTRISREASGKDVERRLVRGYDPETMD